MENARTVEERELEGKVVDLLKEYGKPVSVGYVAENLKVCWSTARGVLFRLSLNGKIAALETSQGFFFSVKGSNN